MHHSIIWYFTCFLCAKAQTLIIVETRAQCTQCLLQQLAKMSNIKDTEALAAKVPANLAAPAAPVGQAPLIAQVAPIIPPAPPAAPTGPVSVLAQGRSNM